jgi:transcriptional regulator with XRE-family HTH domain
VGTTFIKAWREHRGLTLDAVAARIGIRGATLSRIENGKIAYTQQTLEPLAAVLGCSVGDLLTRHPSHASKDEMSQIMEALAPEDRNRWIAAIRAWVGKAA